jgi:adenosylcobyric acid synthase
MWARVLLVADIDRGGAFAALIGTMNLLGRGDRAHVAGYVLNKFRGDVSLLEPAFEEISRRIKRPFFGVVPMIEGLCLPEEDSINFRSETYKLLLL